MTHAFDGNGLRPYGPVHLSITLTPGGLHFGWIRRTRADGDSWDLADVPLGEESELYQVRVLVDGALIRELTTSDPDWFYSDSQRSADGVADAFGIEISQISARYGAGPARAVRVNAA